RRVQPGEAQMPSPGSTVLSTTMVLPGTWGINERNRSKVASLAFIGIGLLPFTTPTGEPFLLGGSAPRSLAQPHVFGCETGRSSLFGSCLQSRWGAADKVDRA